MAKLKYILAASFLAIAGIFLMKHYTYSLPHTEPLSAWSWKQVTSQELDYATAEGIDTLYVSIDEYLDIFEMTDEQQKEEKLKNFEQSLAISLRGAQEKGIAVHALAGSPAWASADYWYLPIEILNFVMRYNKAHPEASFAGVQYDIEFYNSEEYKTSPEILSTEYLKLITQLVVITQSDQAQNLSLGLTMPYWFDNENGNAPILTWESQNQPIAFHILDILNMIPNSYVALMAYRNYAEGPGGAIQISEAEIEYANKLANVSVIVGQETEKNEVERITFYTNGKGALVSALTEISNAFSSFRSFGGIALHTLQAVKELK